MRLYSPKTKKNSTPLLGDLSFELSGSAQGLLLTVFCLVFVAGGTYLYSVNKSAVQGYSMRSLEKEIQELKKRNAVLKVEEAEVRALSRVQAGSLELRMEKVDTTEILSFENTVALR